MVGSSALLHRVSRLCIVYRVVYKFSADAVKPISVPTGKFGRKHPVSRGEWPLNEVFSAARSRRGSASGPDRQKSIDDILHLVPAGAALGLDGQALHHGREALGQCLRIDTVRQIALGLGAFQTFHYRGFR